MKSLFYRATPDQPAEMRSFFKEGYTSEEKYITETKGHILSDETIKGKTAGGYHDWSKHTLGEIFWHWKSEFSTTYSAFRRVEDSPRNAHGVYYESIATMGTGTKTHMGESVDTLSKKWTLTSPPEDDDSGDESHDYSLPPFSYTTPVYSVEFDPNTDVDFISSSTSGTLSSMVETHQFKHGARTSEVKVGAPYFYEAVIERLKGHLDATDFGEWSAAKLLESESMIGTALFTQNVVDREVQGKDLCWYLHYEIPENISPEERAALPTRHVAIIRTVKDTGGEEKDVKIVSIELSPGESSKVYTTNATYDAKIPEGGTVTVGLLPVELAIDANRDDTITSGETASQEKPFRFWINEDADSWGGDDHPETIDLSFHDSDGPPNLGGGGVTVASGYITCKRDLEDFTMLRCDVSALKDQIANGQMQVGLKWTSGSAGLKVYKCPSTIERTLDFISDDQKAGQLKEHEAIANVTGGTATWLPADTFGTEANFHPYLVFEGASTGTGKLTLMIKSNGQEIEGPGVWIKLMHASEMIHRAYATYHGGTEPTDVPDAWDNPTPDAMGWKPDTNYTFSKDPDETDECVIHVHGWRMDDSEARNWSEMSFKRLWHLGYKGRVASFRWPTYSGEFAGYFTYNSSEYRALLSGPALAGFVNSLPFSSSNRKLFAHSMGNVVTGSALRAGLSINGGYVMQHAAMAAMAYDGSGNVETWDRHTPDDDLFAENRALGLRNKFNFASPSIYNFCLPADSALASWQDNQTLAKPQPFTLTSYYYDRFRSGSNHHLFYGINGIGGPFGSGRDVTELAEALAYVTQSRSNAVGATWATAGCIDGKINLNDEFGFADEHSAEWNRRIQLVYPYWRKLAKTLNLEINEGEAP